MQKIKAICKQDKRYHREAYFFLREALEYTVKSLRKTDTSTRRHISGQELSEGFRVLALQEFGPLALKVLNTWGLQRTEDIGEIVFNLVEAGELGKTNEDKREDFANGYDFQEAFANPYLPDGESVNKEDT